MSSLYDPDVVGFEPGPPGHKLSWKAVAFGSYQNYECECGHNLSHCLVKQNGKVGASGARQWRYHIEAIKAPPADELIPVGVIEMARTKVEVYVIGRAHPDVLSWDEQGQYRSFINNPTGWQQQYLYLIATRRSPTNKKTKRAPKLAIIGMARTKTEGVAQADVYITRHYDKGYVVKREDADFAPPAMQASSSFVDMLDRVDKTIGEGNIVEIKELLEEVQLVLGMVPVLEKKREELQKAQQAQVQRMFQ